MGESEPTQPRPLPKLRNWGMALAVQFIALVVVLSADTAIIVFANRPEGLPEVAWLAVGSFFTAVAAERQQILNYMTGANE